MERPKHIQKEPYVEPPEVRAQAWLAQNAPTFIKQLEVMRHAVWEKAMKGVSEGTSVIPPDLFDFETRLLEEMPVCAFWVEWAKNHPIPTGFQLVRGSVLALDNAFSDSPAQAKRINHIYLGALDDPGIVLDHCAAQFYRRKPNTQFNRGDRLLAVKELAGDLFTPMRVGRGEDHFFLLGSKSKVVQRTGMVYDSFGSNGKLW